MAYPPPGPADDGDRDDLAALDFGAVGDEDSDDSNLGAIVGDLVTEAVACQDHSDTPMFTVANPPGTVAVTTLADGRVHQIDLSPHATSLSEHHLAEEIVTIAGLATQDARSAQYTVMLDGMREHGHDDVATRDFLNRDLDLPTPEQARAARAELFTTRYPGDE